MDNLDVIGDWVGQGRLFDLGYVGFNLYGGRVKNFPERAKPIGEPFFVITQKGEDGASEIERKIKERYSGFPNSYRVVRGCVDGATLLNWYEVQAYDTNEEWLRRRLERAPERVSASHIRREWRL